jgi:hypothetical protein
MPAGLALFHEALSKLLELATVLRLAGLFLASSVSFFPWSLWAKSLARLNSDAIVRSFVRAKAPGRRRAPIVAANY